MIDEQDIYSEFSTPEFPLISSEKYVQIKEIITDKLLMIIFKQRKLFKPTTIHNLVQGYDWVGSSKVPSFIHSFIHSFSK